MQTGKSKRRPAYALALRAALGRVEVLALFPLLSLAAFWIGGDAALFAAAGLLPLLLAIQVLALPETQAPGARTPTDGTTGLPLSDALHAGLEAALTGPDARGRTTVCILLAIDDFHLISERWGPAKSEHVLKRCAERLTGAVRGRDVVARIGPYTFGIGLQAVRHLQVGDRLAIVDRLKRVLSEPIVMDGTVMHLSVSMGLCAAEQAPERTADAIVEAAEMALTEARRNGPAATRAFSSDLKVRKLRQTELRSDVAGALAAGHIQPWFQPQISTDTGQITGFEALARWDHPRAGLLSPVEFLPAIAEAGKMSALGEAMLYRALAALVEWDRAGLAVPSVAVNFSADELRDPDLADRLKWEVDRFELRPHRLTVEILETVASRADDDIVVRNIRMMGEHGFNLDLDDFGTGQASIQNIRRFRVNRIKIDRSFVMRVDTDAEQRAMVTGILSLAQRLGIDTLAEGVETLGEHAMLAQLGCGHVQGFGLARPMPFDRTIDWMTEHRRKLDLTPGLERKHG